MGCCSSTLRLSVISVADDEYSTRSLISSNIALDFNKVITLNLKLKEIVESYYDTIMPNIKDYLDAVLQWLDDLLSGIAIIRRTFISRHSTFNDKKKKQQQKQRRKHVNANYSKIVAELNKLMLFPSYLALGTLEETMDLLHLQMERISKRKRSMKLWRRVCAAVVMTAAVGMLMVSIGLALAGAGPVAITAAASGATAIKAVEPLVDIALEEKERKLKEEEEIVEMMRDGERLMVHEFNGVRRLVNTMTEEIMDKYLNFARHIKTAEKAATEIDKMIDEVDSDATELKGKINVYRYKIEQYEAKFLGMIKK